MGRSGWGFCVCLNLYNYRCALFGRIIYVSSKVCGENGGPVSVCF